MGCGSSSPNISYDERTLKKPIYYNVSSKNFNKNDFNRVSEMI